MRGRIPAIVTALVLIAASLGVRSAAQDDGAAQKSAPEQPSASLPPAQEPSVTVLGSRQAQSVMGRVVHSSANEDMGRIVDVIVDRTGRVRAAIIDFGGFLGVGSRKIAVDWDALHFPPANSTPDVVTLDLTRDQVKAAPEYKDKQPVVVLGASGGLQSLPLD